MVIQENKAGIHIMYNNIRLLRPHLDYKLRPGFISCYLHTACLVPSSIIHVTSTELELTDQHCTTKINPRSSE